MMHHSRSISPRPSLHPQSLLWLCTWLSLPLTMGMLSLQQQAQAIDLENSPAITEPAPVASPVDTFIDSEPVWEPDPVPVVPAPPEPIAQPAPPAAPSAPAISPQMMPQVAEQAPSAPATENTFIDDPAVIDSGETASAPVPQETVLSGSVSGCQASLNIDPVLAATLCGPRIQTAQQPAPTRQYTPAAPAQTYAYQPPQPQPAPQWAAYPSSYAPSYVPKTAPTPWVTGAKTSPNLLASASSSLQLLPSSPNPLKWLVPNRQRMIFPLPMPASVTSAFGWRTHPISGTTSFHTGTDLAAPTGTPVLAAFPGQVQTAGFMGGYGLAILLHHQDGQLATRYAHLSKIYVQPGQWVSQGTIIGLVGSTGNSTGPHLHFETLKKQDKNLVAFDSGIQLKASLAELIKAMQTAKVPPKPQS